MKFILIGYVIRIGAGAKGRSHKIVGLWVYILWMLQKLHFSHESLTRISHAKDQNPDMAQSDDVPERVNPRFCITRQVSLLGDEDTSTEVGWGT